SAARVSYTTSEDAALDGGFGSSTSWPVLLSTRVAWLVALTRQVPSTRRVVLAGDGLHQGRSPSASGLARCPAEEPGNAPGAADQRADLSDTGGGQAAHAGSS